MAVYHQILELDPNHIDVLTGVGRYFNDLGRRASDSARVYQEADDEAGADNWMAKRDVAFDSSRTYFKRAFQTDPTDVFVADMYALISALRQEYNDAAEGYSKLTELQPDNADYWTYLGDIQVRLNDFDQAIHSYEQTVSLQPDEADIWEQLADLYQNQKMPAKESEARKKVKELRP
jgi:cytochrome c-type biogenesis protein CcmH/NrfG